MGQVNFAYYAAHEIESQEVGIGDVHSEHLLNDIEAILPFVFIEPIHPI